MNVHMLNYVGTVGYQQIGEMAYIQKQLACAIHTTIMLHSKSGGMAGVIWILQSSTICVVTVIAVHAAVFLFRQI
jgi:hypothetical protein